MEMLEHLKARRTVRKFKPDPIPQEVLDEIGYAYDRRGLLSTRVRIRRSALDRVTVPDSTGTLVVEIAR